MHNTSLNLSDYRAVIFDMDGVIIDSMPSLERTAIQVMREFDIPTDPEYLDLKKYAGASRNALEADIMHRFNIEVDWPTFYHRFEEVSIDLLRIVQPIPHVMRFLQILKEKDFKLGLATSASRNLLAKISAKYHFDSLFDVMLCGDDTQKHKPDPQIFLLAAERLVLPPIHCIVVEDSVNGIVAAKAAGMKCIAITTTFKADSLDAADVILDDFDQAYEKLCNSHAA